MSCVSHALASVHCCLVVTWERADLLALVGDVYCIFVTFPFGILGQVWHLIVSFPDLCRLSYFVRASNVLTKVHVRTGSSEPLQLAYAIRSLFRKADKLRWAILLVQNPDMNDMWRF